MALVFNRANDDYLFTIAEARGKVGEKLRLRSADSAAFIDICNNGGIDLSGTGNITIKGKAIADENSVVLKAGTQEVTGDKNFTGTTTLASVDINGGDIDGATIATSDITVGAGKTLNVSAGTLTTSATQNLAILQGAGANVDIGAYDLRANTLTADGLTDTELVFAGTNGLLTSNSNLTFSTDTLTATKIGAFQAAGAINFDSQDMTNVDIDSGTIDGVTIGASTAAAATFTEINLYHASGNSTITKDTNKITLDPHPAGGDISGTVVIKGDLIVDGTTTTINSTNVDISDSILTLNSNLASNVAASLDAGFIVNRGSNSDVSFLWDETNNRWTIGSETFVAGTVIADVTGNVTGNVSGSSGSCTGNAETVTNGVYTTSSVTDLNDVTSAGSGSIITSDERTKLSGIETGADVTDATNVAAAGAVMNSGDQTIAGTKTFSSTIDGSINGNAVTVTNGVYTTSSVTVLNDVTSAGSGSIITSDERTKLSGIETGADVTDATNVAAAGAVMNSGDQTIAGTKTFSSTIDGSINGNAATVTNGVYTTSSVTDLNDVTSAGSGSIITSDERTKLSGIETGADVTDATNVAAAGAVMNSGDQTIAGTKTFSSTIDGSINGNAATATTLANVRTINGVSFDGSANISTVPVSYNSFALKNSGFTDLSGTTTGWQDATGYSLTKTLSSSNSLVKMEFKVNFISSPEADQTLSFQVLRSTNGGTNYNGTPVFTDENIGSNMGVTIRGVYNGTYIDTPGGTDIAYKLQFKREGTDIDTSFGIVGGGNYIFLQELYEA